MEKIPVTILTGFLGAGKTTLLNRLLDALPDRRVAVIENEFGNIAIDAELIRRPRTKIVELANGCVCCSVRGDLLASLETLREEPRPERVFVETSGLADPGPILQMFLMSEGISDLFRLDSVITVADAAGLLEDSNDYGEALAQIALADILLLNKTDLVDPKALTGLETWLRSMNPGAVIHRTKNADIDVGMLLDTGGFDIARALERDLSLGAAYEAGGHSHTEDVNAVGTAFEEPLDKDKLLDWAVGWLAKRGGVVLRIKGILHVSGSPNPYIFESVRNIVGTRDGEPWGDRPRKSQIVFIGQGLSETEILDGLMGCRVPKTFQS